MHLCLKLKRHFQGDLNGRRTGMLFFALDTQGCVHDLYSITLLYYMIKLALLLLVSLLYKTLIYYICQYLHEGQNKYKSCLSSCGISYFDFFINLLCNDMKHILKARMVMIN